MNAQERHARIERRCVSFTVTAQVFIDVSEAVKFVKFPLQGQLHHQLYRFPRLGTLLENIANSETKSSSNHPITSLRALFQISKRLHPHPSAWLQVVDASAARSAALVVAAPPTAASALASQPAPGRCRPSARTPSWSSQRKMRWTPTPASASRPRR